MDNTGNSNRQSANELDKPIPFDDSDEPIRLDEKPAGGSPGVSRAPLNLGGGGPAPAPARKAPAPAVRVAAPKPAPAKAAAAPVMATGGRITGCKTFFTKLHAGALEFLDGQITNWLSENPDILIKSTNVSVGEVAAKKTEPNILIVVWY